MKNIKKHPSKNVKTCDLKKTECNVNVASKEIMLNRIFDGNRFEFPFSNYLN